MSRDHLTPFTLTSLPLPVFRQFASDDRFSFFICASQMNSMNSVSSSEDIKPPPGLQNMGSINYQCPSPGGMSKHICAICGDRSSGDLEGNSTQGGTSTQGLPSAEDDTFPFLRVQGNTTACTAARDAKVFSRGPCAKISLTLVETAKSASSTSASATAASTVATRSA